MLFVNEKGEQIAKPVVMAGVPTPGDVVIFRPEEPYVVAGRQWDWSTSPATITIMLRAKR